MVDIVVLPMGLQTHSVPSVLFLTPSLGMLCSDQWMAVSIHFHICPTLTEPLRRQLFLASVSKYFLASTIVSEFDDCIWNGSPSGTVSGLSFSLWSTHCVLISSYKYLVPPFKKDRSIYASLFLLFEFHVV